MIHHLLKVVPSPQYSNNSRSEEGPHVSTLTLKFHKEAVFRCLSLDVVEGK